MRRGAHIMIADDHQLFAEGVSRILLEQDYVVSIVTQLAVLEGSVRSARPDLLLLDLSFGKDSALPLLKRLRAQPKPLKVIVLSARNEPVIIEAVERTGAPFLAKSRASTELLTMVAQCLAGTTPVRSVTGGATSAFRVIGMVELSERQINVLLGVHAGHSNAEIAETMGVTPKAIEPHLRSLRERIGIGSRAELARWAETHLVELRGGM